MAFQFTGELRGSTGLTHLRERNLGNGLVLLFSEDCSTGDGSHPYTLHPFSYVGNNPVNLPHPSGKCYGPFRPEFAFLEPGLRIHRHDSIAGR